MKQNIKDTQVEQRRKRFFTPIIYMMAEIVFVWLVLSLVNVSFDIISWGSFSILILYFTATYSVYKTFVIYKRQEDYPKV